MFNYNGHIKSALKLFVAFFVMFSLSPCAVKTSAFGSVGVDYSKPLNTSKITGTNLNCQFSQDNIQSSTTQKSKFASKKAPDFALKISIAEDYKTNVFEHYQQTIFANAPPKYILYKRLKLDLV